MKYFQRSIDEKRLANHGPCYEIARDKIKKQLTFNTMLCNATIGLELALRARFRPGTRVMIPNFTFVATLRAVIAAGMIPVIGRVDELTWALDPEELRSHKGPAIVVSPFGHGIDFDTYESIGYPIVYDLAGAWGLPYRGENVAVYSWHATKRFCVGEGACVVSNDFRIINEIDRLSNFGHTNAKISEIHCAIACALLESGIPSYQHHYFYYWNNLINHKGFEVCSGTSENVSMLCFKFNPKAIYELQKQTVFMTRRYYYPLMDADLNPGMQSIFALPRDSQHELVVQELRSLLGDL